MVDSRLHWRRGPAGYRYIATACPRPSARAVYRYRLWQAPWQLPIPETQALVLEEDGIMTGEDWTSWSTYPVAIDSRQVYAMY